MKAVRWIVADDDTSEYHYAFDPQPNWIYCKIV